MAASELAWYPLKTKKMRQNVLFMYVRKEKSLDRCNLCWDCSVFRNLGIPFLSFSLPRMGEDHFSYKSCYKTELLEYNKTEESWCSTEQVHS